VKTEYKVSITHSSDSTRILDGVLTNSLNIDVYYVLTEEYGDVMKVDGRMLPFSYSVHYSREGRWGHIMARWTMEALRWSHNSPINRQFYKVQ
jgi:hypothetical protein